LVLPFWYRLTWVVLEKGPLNGCVLHRTASFYVLSVKIHASVSAVGDWKNQKSSKHAYRVANMGV